MNCYFVQYIRFTTIYGFSSCLCLLKCFQKLRLVMLASCLSSFIHPILWIHHHAPKVAGGLPCHPSIALEFPGKGNGKRLGLLILSSGENKLASLSKYFQCLNTNFQELIYIVKESFLVLELHNKSPYYLAWEAVAPGWGQMAQVSLQRLDLQGHGRLSRALCRNKESR